MSGMFVQMFVFVLVCVIAWRYGGWWYRRRRNRPRKLALPWPAYDGPADSPPPIPERIAFDRETQMRYHTRTKAEQRIWEATHPQTGGPVLIAEAQKPRPKQLIITPREARIIEEFVPDFPVTPGRWLYIGDWPDGWDEMEESE